MTKWDAMKPKQMVAGLALCALASLMTASDWCGPNAVPILEFHHNWINWSPDGSTLVFTDAWVYAVKADGSALKRVGSRGGRQGSVLYPEFSPDGSKIVYTFKSDSSILNSGSNPFTIETINADGSSSGKLEGVPSSDSLSPAWSPDGSRIAFVSPSRGYGEECCYYLYSMSADGSDIRQEVRFSLATIHPPGEWSPPRFLPVTTQPPAWSPNGKRLAFIGKERRSESFSDIRYAAYTVASGGSDLTRVGETWTRPAWSPDGGRLALLKTHEDRGLLYTVNPDGSDPIDVAHFVYGRPVNYSAQAVGWSPDGTRLLISGLASGTKALPLVIFKADGSEFNKEPSPLTWRGYASWAPDGSRIAVYDPEGFIFTVRPDGSDRLFLIAPGGDGPLLVSK